MTTLSQEIEAKYEVLQKMGEGGMGSVYKVRHRFLDDVQVIKLMQAKFQENAELKTRFLREAKTAKQLKHPNIAEVIDFNLTADGTAYIVMEFIEGVNMGEVLARTGGPLDFRLVVTVARQTLTALGFLHRKKFVHRDISPDNLMLTRDSEGNVLVKLIDLGITKSIEETRNLTMAGKFIGKVQYASPEQFGGEVDRRSDLYSFGIVMYELLTGIKPIGGSDYLNIITGHMTRPPRPFEETDPNARVPILLRRAVLKALEKNPDHRHQTADEFAEALKDLDVGNFDATVEVLLPAAIAALPGEGGDAMERADWDAATASDTIRAWDSYLDRHGSSSRADRARVRLEQLEAIEEADWTMAAQSESSDAWRRYLEKHGESPRASMARRRLEKMRAAETDERAWSDAFAASSAPAWDLFIAAHPTSPRIEEAKQLLAAARERAEDERAWRMAETSDSTGGWREYLEGHPSSARIDEARSRLRSTEERRAEIKAWERAVVADSSDAWRGYIRDYAHSARIAEANAQLTRALEREAEEKREKDARRQQKVEQEAFDGAVRLGSAPAWESFIRDHPQSKRLGDAMKRLAALREEERKAAERADRERKRAAEDSSWDAARTARTTSELRLFLEQHPKSRHAGEAQALVSLLEEEKRLAEQRAEEKRTEAARAETRRAEEKRAEQQRAEAKRAEERRAEERRAEERRAEVTRAEAQRRLAAVEAQKAGELTEPETRIPVAPAPPPPLPFASAAEPASTARAFGGMKALVAVIVIVVAIVAAFLVIGRDDGPVDDPAVAETTETTADPATLLGELVIHAAPWGEVRSVKNGAGEEQLASTPLYTPLTLRLPAGAYKVELTNPNSGRSATVDATVEAGRPSRCEAELDRVDADAYLRRVLK